MFYEKTVLDNGITVLTDRMSSVRSVTMGLWFKVGSRDEEEEQAGMSHFMEHMMFKGTPTRTALDISSSFDALGAELNAYTTREYTCYYSRVVDDRVEKAVEMLSDMVVNSLFAQEEIDLEREVVIEEIKRGLDNPEDLVWDLHTEAMFPTSPIGRPIAGTAEVVSGFDHADCIAYHNRFYCGENMVVAFAGNIEHAQAVAYVEKYLADLPKGTANLRQPTLEDPGKPFVSHTKDTEQAHLVIGMRAYGMGHPDRYALALLNMAMGGGMSSRLFQEVREKRGLAYSVFCQGATHTDAGEVCISAGTRPENLELVMEVVNDQIDLLLKDGLTQEELSRVCDYITGQFVLALESTRGRMTRLGRLGVLEQKILSVDEIIAGYRKVTLDDVARVAHDVFTRPRTIAVVSPHTEDELAAIGLA